jgi:hypothetical protein
LASRQKKTPASLAGGKTKPTMIATARTEDRIATTPPFLIRSAKAECFVLDAFSRRKASTRRKKHPRKGGQKAECRFAASANSDNLRSADQPGAVANSENEHLKRERVLCEQGRPKQRHPTKKRGKDCPRILSAVPSGQMPRYFHHEIAENGNNPFTTASAFPLNSHPRIGGELPHLNVQENRARDGCQALGTSGTALRNRLPRPPARSMTVIESGADPVSRRSAPYRGERRRQAYMPIRCGALGLP